MLAIHSRNSFDAFIGRVVDDVFRTEELVLELVFLLNKVLTSVYIKKTVIHLYIFYIH